MMLAQSTLSQLSAPYSHLINWQGASGRAYATVAEAIENFRLDDCGIYVLVASGRAIWVGTADDIIHDHVSRSDFSGALSNASMALRLNKPEGEVERMSLIFDLQSGHQIAALTAA